MTPVPVVHFPPRYGNGPRLVPVEAHEVEVDGERLLALSTNGRELPLMLSEETLAIARYFDGTRSLRDVQLAIHRDFGQLLYVERLHTLALALWREGLFENVPPPAERH